VLVISICRRVDVSVAEDDGKSVEGAEEEVEDK
jgi:hypothetical protein